MCSALQWMHIICYYIRCLVRHQELLVPCTGPSGKSRVILSNTRLFVVNGNMQWDVTQSMALTLRSANGVLQTTSLTVKMLSSTIMLTSCNRLQYQNHVKESILYTCTVCPLEIYNWITVHFYITSAFQLRKCVFIKIIYIPSSILNLKQPITQPNTT